MILGIDYKYGVTLGVLQAFSVNVEALKSSNSYQH